MKLSSINQQVVNRYAKKQTCLKTPIHQNKHSNKNFCYYTPLATKNTCSLNFCSNITKLNEKITNSLSKNLSKSIASKALVLLALLIPIMNKFINNENAKIDIKPDKQAMTGIQESKDTFIKNETQYHQG